MRENRTRKLSVFVAAVFILSLGLSLPVLNSYFLDLAGVAFTIPTLAILLVVEAVVIVLVFWRAGWRLAATEKARLISSAIAFVLVLAPALFLLSPSFLPVSASVDAVHHYLLVDYIYTHQRLVHDPLVADVLGEMVGYPFAASLLTALAAQVLGLPPITMMVAMCAVLAACTAAFAYATVTEMTGTRQGEIVALLVAPILLWPVPYSFGQFTRDFFLTQMLGITSVIGLGYWLSHYIKCRDRIALFPIVCLGTTLIFAYPILMPIFGVAFVVAPFLTSERPAIHAVFHDALLVGLPLMVLAVLYLHDRINLGIGILQHDGDTISPGLDTLPLGFVALSLLGLLIATKFPAFRSACLPVWLAVIQTLTFYGAVAFLHQLSPYAAKKMMFVVVPEFAVAAALAVVYIFGLVTVVGPARVYVRIAVALGITVVIGFGFGDAWLATYLAFDPRPIHRLPLTADELAVANWTKLNLPKQPLTYVADNWITSYWIDVGLLKNRRNPTQFNVINASVADSGQNCPSGGLTDNVLVTKGADAWAVGGVQTLFRQGDVAVLRGWTARQLVPFDDIALLTTSDSPTNLVLSCVAMSDQPDRPGKWASLLVIFSTTGSLNRDYVVEARLRDRAGQIVSRVDVPFVPYDQAVGVTPGHTLAIPVMIPLPPSLGVGAYPVDLVFFDDRWGTLRLAAPGAPRHTVTVGPVLIASGAELPTAGTRPGTTVDDHLGQVLDLVGFDAPTVENGNLSIDLLWQATRPVSTDYTFFVQLLNEQGKVVAQVDSFPWQGNYATSAWTPGRLVRDRKRLILPTALPAGTYQLIAGAYQLETMQRLAVDGPDGQPRGDFVALTTLSITR